MIPSFLQPKELPPTTESDIQQFSKLGEVECASCFKKIDVNKSYIVLIYGEDSFKPICYNCSNIRGLGKIDYIERYETYNKRLKSGYFNDWKVKAYESN
jgi:hypothetical protein